MRHRHAARALALAAFAADALGAETTIKNDSLTDFSNASVVSGFASGEQAAAWLTSTCNGSVVAAQVFWRSNTGTTGQAIENSIDVARSGTFPGEGAIVATIGGPVLQDGVVNEFRYLDENNTIPLDVPVTQGETFVVSLTFNDPPPAAGPSVVVDADGCQAGRNALFGDIGFGNQWYDACTLGVSGDWVIRAVVDCQTGTPNADVGVTMSAQPTSYTPGAALAYTIVVANAGPAGAPNVSVADNFPSAYNGVTWICTASGGATCTSGGSGSINQLVSLPSGGQVSYAVTGTVSAAATGTLSNTASVLVIPPVVDPVSSNNSATVDAPQNVDLIFRNGFDAG